ncbi:helix-turn-helix domain-containing protein [Nostocales cyanobacterium HT-58-2]|nr:helix-turn-helix domain-containing protein [Nostocales cyanobacterium HT-58-2]
MKLLNKAQEEQLMEIVAHLRQVREEKSIRLEEVAAYTRIRLAFLHALEEGRFEELPEPVYVQGFIRHYGDAMGLDGSALAQTVGNICLTPPEPNNDNQELEKKPSVYIPLVVPYVLLLAAASFGLFYILNPQRSVDSSSQRKSSPIASKQKAAPVPKTSSSASATATGGSPAIPTSPATSPALTQQQSNASPLNGGNIDTQVTPQIRKPSSVASPNPTASLSPEATSLLAVPTPPETLSPAVTPTLTPSPTAETTPVEVTLELQDKSWLRVKVDGKTEFEGELNKGEKKTWIAKKELTIRSGNAGAVLVSANKKHATPLGSMGSVKQITFTPETVNNTPETVNSQ